MKIRRDGILETQPISGTITSNIGTTNGLALDATLTAAQPRDITDRVGRLLGHTSVDNFPAIQLVSLVPLTSASTGQSNITSTPTLISGPLANRKTIRIKSFANNSTAVYIGFTSGVSSTTGDELAAGEAIDIEIDGSISIYIVAVSGTQRVSWTEVA